jgi:hypothetical protein
MAHPVPLARLAAVVEQLRSGALDGDAARWLGAGLDGWLGGEARLEDALGLPPTWRRSLRHAARDRLLRRLATDLPGRTSARAAALQAELRGYQSNGWLRERHLSALPASASPRRRLLHEVMRLDPGTPTSFRRLFNILDDCNKGDVVIACWPEDTAPNSE